MRRWFSDWVGWVRVAAFLALFLGLVVRVGDPEPISALRHGAFDFYHQVKPRKLSDSPVVIIDIDDRSIDRAGQWPWPRTRIAEIVRRATNEGAVAIAFDIVFSEPDRLSPEKVAEDNRDLPPDIANQLRQMPKNDDVLAQAFANSRIVAGLASVRTTAGNRGAKRKMSEVPHALVGPDPRRYLGRYPDVIQNLPQLEAAAAGHGLFAARPDADGVYRRVPLVGNVQDNIRLGLAPELLRVATGGGAFAVRTNKAGVEGVVLAGQLVRTGGDGTVWPYLTPSARSRYISAVDVLNGTVSRDRLQGRLVLVGTSAIGLEDFRPTPLGVAMAGVEIHAQVLENILEKSLLNRPNHAIGIELVVTFFLCALVIIFAPKMAARWLILSSLLLLGAYVATSYYLFHQNRVLLDPTFPVLAAMSAVMLMSTVNYLREERQRRVIRSAFGQYVSPDLVERLSRDQRALKLGGETREITLLFSDVRGFTAIAEDFKDDPEALTRLMNEFLTILSNAILENNGTIDKFMGDAVMAFWNAPTANPDHLRSACRAALRMMTDIRAYNKRREATVRLKRMQRRKADARAGWRSVRTGARPDEKVHKIDVGIGINTGTCVVGNMGSDTRFDYTALGDPVNVASRLEGQSRYYGVQVILGFATAREVVNELAVMELDTVKVLGKELPETIFALLGDESLFAEEAFRAACELNRQMLAAYRGHDWDQAEAMLDELQHRFKDLKLGLDKYLGIYRDRIAELRQNAPGPDWNGVFAFTQKTA